MRKQHIDEYKYHRLSLWVQLAAMVCSHLMKIYQFIHMLRCLFSDNCKYVMSKAEMAFSIISVSHLLIPLVIVYFKSSKDIFMCFSKLQALGQVSRFQKMVTNNEETSIGSFSMTE